MVLEEVEGLYLLTCGQLTVQSSVFMYTIHIQVKYKYMKQEIWVTLQIGEQTVYRNYIIGGDSEFQSVEDIDWNIQLPDMADSIEQSLALDGKIL